MKKKKRSAESLRKQSETWARKRAEKNGSNGKLAHVEPPEVTASLDEALKQIEQAGKTIAAIRDAARKVFG